MQPDGLVLSQFLVECGDWYQKTAGQIDHEYYSIATFCHRECMMQIQLDLTFAKLFKMALVLGDLPEDFEGVVMFLGS